MKKRDFILSGCSTAAVSMASATNARVEASGSGLSMRRLQRFPDLEASSRHSAWRQYVGQRFIQPTSTGPKEVVLRDIEQHNADGRMEQFILVFVGTGDAAIFDGTQLLRHAPSGQRIPIYLQSAGTDVNGSTMYRAEFNQLI